MIEPTNVEYFVDVELMEEYISLLVYNLELINNSLNSIYLVLILILSFGLVLLITLVIYFTLKKFFY